MLTHPPPYPTIYPLLRITLQKGDLYVVLVLKDSDRALSVPVSSITIKMHGQK